MRTTLRCHVRVTRRGVARKQSHDGIDMQLVRVRGTIRETVEALRSTIPMHAYDAYEPTCDNACI